MKSYAKIIIKCAAISSDLIAIILIYSVSEKKTVYTALSSEGYLFDWPSISGRPDLMAVHAIVTTLRLQFETVGKCYFEDLSRRAVKTPIESHTAACTSRL